MSLNITGNKLVVILGHAVGQKIVMPNVGIVARIRKMATSAVIVTAIMTK